MSRQTLTNGRWFNPDGAALFQEDTRWDGHNHISVATGSQGDHEKIYRTAGGRWVLHTWSQYEAVPDSFVEIDVEAAASWLVANGHAPEEVIAVINTLEVR